MVMNIRRYINILGYKYMNIKYKLPKGCKVSFFTSIYNLKCEGYNTIGKNAVINNVTLGFASGISMNSFFCDTVIGRYTVLGPRIIVIRGQHPTSRFVSVHPAFYSLKKQYGFTYINRQKFDEFVYVDLNKKTAVIIGNDVWIGADVRIMEGVKIGDGAIVAAGAVVVNDVLPYSIVGGVPAKVIKSRFTEDDIQFLLQLKWWDKSEEWIRSNAKYFEDIAILREKNQ